MSSHDPLALAIAELNALERKGLEEEYMQHLEECCEVFMETDQYKNDIRYIKLWLNFISQYAEEEEFIEVRAFESNTINY
jgi:hypothetical protein